MGINRYSSQKIKIIFKIYMNPSQYSIENYIEHLVKIKNLIIFKVFSLEYVEPVQDMYIRFNIIFL